MTEPLFHTVRIQKRLRRCVLKAVHCSIVTLPKAQCLLHRCDNELLVAVNYLSHANQRPTCLQQWIKNIKIVTNQQQNRTTLRRHVWIDCFHLTVTRSFPSVIHWLTSWMKERLLRVASLGAKSVCAATSFSCWNIDGILMFEYRPSKFDVELVILHLVDEMQSRP